MNDNIKKMLVQSMPIDENSSFSCWMKEERSNKTINYTVVRIFSKLMFYKNGQPIKEYKQLELNF